MSDVHAPLPAIRSKRIPKPQTALEAFMPPPMGGLNTLSPAAAMDPQDAVAIQNLIPSELGTRVRLGSSEWCTGIDSGSPVLSVLPFSASIAANNKLFVTTTNGIWDVSASSTSVSKVVSFDSTAAPAGFGICHVMVNSDYGHLLMYCDEANGYYLYSETANAWQKVVSHTQAAWAQSTGYTAGQYVLSGDGNVHLCVQSGTSSNSGTGPASTSITAPETDGAAQWLFNFSVSGVDPATFVHVMAWKSHAWFTQANSADTWFLPINQVAGAASKFAMGGQFKAGGYCIGLYNLTFDGAVGIDNFLAAISSGGDVAIWQGTDPTDATKFGLKGVWQVGALPAGRKIATSLGGDVLVSSLVGLMPLSKLLNGNPAGDMSQYATAKVQALFNYYTGLYGQNLGWDMVLDPLDNALLVLVPFTSGQPGTQLAMSLSTRGWFPYSGLPMTCAAPWNGTLYFGTSDGRVVAHQGYVDGVTLADPSASTPIQWYALPAFQNLGSPRQKKIEILRPKVLASSGAPPIQCAGRYDFDTTPPAPVSGSVAGSGNSWDSAVWDVSTWGGDYSTSQPVQGSVGMGVHVSFVVAGLANSRTVYAGADVLYSVGGFL